MEQVSGEVLRALDIPMSQPSLSEAFEELFCAVGWTGACRQNVCRAVSPAITTAALTSADLYLQGLVLRNQGRFAQLRRF